MDSDNTSRSGGWSKVLSERILRSLRRGKRANKNSLASVHFEDSLQLAAGSFNVRVGAVLLAFLAIAAFLLLSEHRAHAFGILPYLLLLLCPVLHLILHGGHRRNGGAHDDHAREGGTR